MQVLTSVPFQKPCKGRWRPPQGIFREFKPLLQAGYIGEYPPQPGYHPEVLPEPLVDGDVFVEIFEKKHILDNGFLGGAEFAPGEAKRHGFAGFAGKVPRQSIKVTSLPCLDIFSVWWYFSIKSCVVSLDLTTFNLSCFGGRMSIVNRWFQFTAFAVLVITAGVCRADTVYDLTYSWPVTSFFNNVITVSGTITTDGVIGSLAPADLVDWNLDITDTDNISSTTLNSINSANDSFLNTNALTATASGLFFNFGLTTDSGLDFYSNVNSANFRMETLPCGTSGCVVETSADGDYGSFLVDTSSSEPIEIGTYSYTTPEPSSYVLTLIGLLILGLMRKRLVQASL